MDSHRWRDRGSNCAGSVVGQKEDDVIVLYCFELFSLAIALCVLVGFVARIYCVGLAIWSMARSDASE